MHLKLSEFAKKRFEIHYGSPYLWKEFHTKVSNSLVNLLAKKTDKNLMICMPPRFGKSELVIRLFVSWCYSFLPDCNFIVACNTMDLAREHVKSIRDIISSEWYSFCFPCGAMIKDEKKLETTIKITKSTARSDYFETLQGGATKAIGLGGLITGFGAGKKSNWFGGCIICDDLLKEQDFNSQSKRDSVYNWFKSAITSRRNSSDTPIIIVMQRLHPDDIVGRLIIEEPDKWDLIKLQAFDEDSQLSNWEDAIKTKDLLSLKNSNAEIDKYMFMAKYQQSPSLDLYSHLKPEWWKYYEHINDIKQNITYRIITMDTAYKTKTINDETVMQLWGFDSIKNAYLLDMVHGRWDFCDLLTKAKQFFFKHNNYLNNKPFNGAVFIEDKASGTSLGQTLKKDGINVKLWLPSDTEPKDKISRVLESSKYIANGRVFIPKNAPYTKEFIDQCSSFSEDEGSHDDMVDAMTMAILIWRKMGA